MKKLIIVFIFLLGFMFMPNVYAEEIPREGVTYFLQYPDGTEDVKEDYDEAIATAEEEKLIFTGQTDENGQVVLENVSSEGTLRVVQEVPNGYSTDEREVIINLQESKKVEFKITHGLINPKTGFSVLAILLILGLVIGGTALTKKNKKVLLVLPLLLVAGLVNVKADSDNLVIDVKDNLGRAQSGVTVKIYAKPKIDAAPAIKFDANGGHFFDGETLMYIRIPHNNCTSEEYREYMYTNRDLYNYIDINISYAHREGYDIDYDVDEPQTFSNGTTIKLLWIQNSDARLVSIHGNGGYYDFYGKKLDVVNLYKSMYSNMILNEFGHDNLYFAGTSEQPTCSNKVFSIDYNNIPDNIYICWSDRPPTLYYNDEYIDFENRLLSAKTTIESSCISETMDHTLYTSDDTTIDFSLTSEQSADVRIEFSDYQLAFLGSFSIETDAETGDSRLAVGPFVVDNNSNISNLKLYGEPVESIGQLDDYFEYTTYGMFRGLFESLSTECIGKIFVEPQVTTQQEI